MSRTKETIGGLDRQAELLPTEQASAGPGIPGWFEALIAAFVAAALYISLYSELPFHDVARFAAQVNSGHFVWDIGHIFLQPATLLWHIYLGFGEAAESSQKHINTFATASAIGIFYALLQRLDIPRWERVFATLLVMTSCSIVILAPSAHMKLLAFPFVNAALYVLVGWEQAEARSDGAHAGRLLAGAGLLAVAASFLASALATAPFAGLAVLFARLKGGAGWPRALVSALLFGVACGLIFLLLACAGYAVFAGAIPSLHGLTGSVADKADLKPAGYSIAANLARLVFGTANNLIDAPDLGSVLRAWMAGEVPSLAPYMRLLVLQALPWLVTLALLAIIYLRTVWAALGGAPCLLPAAFLCGAQTWTIYYGLNDPEHWFQLTVPTVVLFLTLFPSGFTRAVLPPWAILTAVINVVVFALPHTLYPLKIYEAQLRTMFSPRDLLISFASYPGGPYLAFFNLPGVPLLMLDTELRATPNPKALFADIDRGAADAFARHGRVVIFGNVLDPYDWNAPWAELSALGIRKRQMLDYFYGRYQVKPLGSLAEIPAWEILPPAGQTSAPAGDH